MANSDAKSLLGSFAVACLFSFFIVLDFGAIYLDIHNVRNTNFGEEGYVEWFQEIQLMTAFIFLLTALKKIKTAQPAIIFMAGCIAMAIIREYNNFFIDNFFHGAWSLLVIIAALITAYSLYKIRKNLIRSFYGFTQTTEYGIVLSGFFITFIFSRFMGIPDFWHIILAKKYIRDVERVAEESIELIGYTMIAFGCSQYALKLGSNTAAKLK